MGRMADIVRFEKDWHNTHPGVPCVIVNQVRYDPEKVDNPLMHRRPGFVGISRLMKILRIGFISALRMVHDEQVTLWVVPGPRKVKREISVAALDYLVRRYNPSAIQFARRGPKGVRLWFRCQKCGVNSRHYRKGLFPDGKQRVQCRTCMQQYVYNSARLPPLQSTCPRCGGTTRQKRAGITPTGRREVVCMLCGKYYTVYPNPDRVVG